MQADPQIRTDSVQAPSEMSEKDGSLEPDSVLSTHEPFRNLDDPIVLQESMEALSAPTSRNFIIEFGDSHAHVAFDLNPSFIQDLLKSDRPDALSTRWINIWYPFHQRSVLEIIARQYDFSPRLLALMCSDPRRPPRRADSNPYAIAAEQDRSMSDLESGSPCPSQQSSDPPSMQQNNAARTGNLYDIVDEVWHYSSIDQGRSYLCLGYNSLYPVGHLLPHDSSPDKTETEQPNQPLPNVKRVWTWLLLLSDRTVITINEDIFPYSSGYLSLTQQQILSETRCNLVNIFRSLSKVEFMFSEKSPLTLLPIRKRLGFTPEETAHRSSDAPGLLFYYLFENWQSLFMGKETSRYGRELQRVRKEMFKLPKLAHIDRLDQIGCQLMVLKRHYKAYLRLIERVAEPQKASMASMANSQVTSKSSRESLSEDGVFGAMMPTRGAFFTVNSRTGDIVDEGVPAGRGDGGVGMVIEAESLLGVGISSAARVRFERLRDMIALYALSECKDYLRQKESLVQMVSSSSISPRSRPPQQSLSTLR